MDSGLGGQSMGPAQLQEELRKMQRLQEEMQSQLQRHRAGQQFPSLRLMDQGMNLPAMRPGMPPNMSHAAVGGLGMSQPQGLVGSEQGTGREQMPRIGGSGLLFDQHGQGGIPTQGMLGHSGTQSPIYMNGLQASAASVGSVGGHSGPVNSSSASLLQQQHPSLTARVYGMVGFPRNQHMLVTGQPNSTTIRHGNGHGAHQSKKQRRTSSSKSPVGSSVMERHMQSSARMSSEGNSPLPSNSIMEGLGLDGSADRREALGSNGQIAMSSTACNYGSMSDPLMDRPLGPPIEEPFGPGQPLEMHEMHFPDVTSTFPQRASGSTNDNSSTSISRYSPFNGMKDPPAEARRASFLGGTFEGGWQSNADLPDRRNTIYLIMQVIEQIQPDARNLSNRLPLMAKRLEEHLYRSARTKQAYLDQATLKKRLQTIAEGLEAHRPARFTQRVHDPGQSSPDHSLSSDVRSSHSMAHMVDDSFRPDAGCGPGATGSTEHDADLGGETKSTPRHLAPTTGTTGILKTTTAKYHDPLVVVRKQRVIRYQQQRLLLLRHASKCRKGASCKTKHCQQMVILWKHMRKCRDKNCRTAHCLSSRCVLNHYKECKSEGRTSSCEVCGPVMKKIRMQQRQVAAGTSDSGAEEASETPAAHISPVPETMSSQLDVNSRSTDLRQEELRIAREAISQQQQLLKELEEQQARLKKQQEMRRSHDQHPGEENAVVQQQDLLERLQQRFHDQQEMIQASIANESRQHSRSSGHESINDVSTYQSNMTEAQSKSSYGMGKSAEHLSHFPERRNSRVTTTDNDSAIFPTKRSLDETTTDVKVSKRPRSHQSVPGEKPDETVGVSDRVPQADPYATSTKSIVQAMSFSFVERHIQSLQGKRNLSSRAISQKCMPLLRRLLSDPCAWVFRDPVDPAALGLPDYYDVVKHPIHLGLIQQRLEESFYHDMESFERDTRLVFDNAILYNGEESDVGGLAKGMLVRFTKDYNEALRGEEDSDESGGDTCSLCCGRRKLFEPTILYCSGICGGQRIRRNGRYFADRSKMNRWCGSCYAELDDNEPIILDDGNEIKKKDLQQSKNDALPEEAWVQCDYCNSWVHQICALFNGRSNKSTVSYMCPKCNVAKKISGELPSADCSHSLKTAKDLPHCNMSRALEEGVQETLLKAYDSRAMELGVAVCEVEKADPIYIRVVSNMEKKHVVRDEMFRHYAGENCPSEYPVRSKCIALFQSIHGVDVLLFAMYVYEYDDSCPAPNRRRVYISYIDSVQYLQPKWCRTIIYHSVVVEYLRYVKTRGFHTAHIWSCPPLPGDDYILHCHPTHQLIPKDEMLCQWYHDVLEKATAEGIVLQTRSLYDEYFRNGVTRTPGGPALTPTSLPYFEGDYIPGEIENVIKEIAAEDGSKSVNNQDSTLGRSEIGQKLGTRSNPGAVLNLAQDRVMLRLGLAISNMKKNFMVVHLLSRDFAAAVERGDDVSNWTANEITKAAKRQKVECGLRSTQEKNTDPAQVDNPHAGAPQNRSNAIERKRDALQATATDEVTSVEDDQPRSKESTRTEEIANKESASEKLSVERVLSKALDIETKSNPSIGAEGDIARGDTAAGGSLESVDHAKRHHQDEKDMPTSQKCIDQKSPDLFPNIEQAPVGTLSSAVVASSTADSMDQLSSMSTTTPAQSLKTGGGGEDLLASQGPPSEPCDSLVDQGPDEATHGDPGKVISTPDVLPNEDPITPIDEPSSVAAVDGGPLDTRSDRSDWQKRDILESKISDRPNGTISSTVDEDEPQENELFESRQQFLNYCQANHFQFDELRRAKHSSMMILFQLHNPTAPMFLQQCGSCYREITHGIRYHCNDCSSFDLCEECYEPVVTGLWAKQDARFAHDSDHKFIPINTEAPPDTQKTREERSHNIKLHLELVSHAATCEGDCSLNNCARMKKLFHHVKTCDVTHKHGCRTCSRLLSLLTMHARLCTVRESCPLPFCDRIRERQKRIRQQQQLMDDRRRKAQNALYRSRGVGDE